MLSNELFVSINLTNISEEFINVEQNERYKVNYNYKKISLCYFSIDDIVQLNLIFKKL